MRFPSSMSEDSTRHRRLPSPAPVSPLDDDNLLEEILLRLPPLPSTLPRASLVCKRWRRLLSDPRFRRRFRAHHRRNPPLLGFFTCNLFGSPIFAPSDRVPASRFAAPRELNGDECRQFLGCRHGLALFLSRLRREAAVWDPMDGHLRRVPLPPGLAADDMCVTNGAVVSSSAAADGNNDVPFKLVMLCRPRHNYSVVLAAVYDSEMGLWSAPIATAATSAVSVNKPSILVGMGKLCWALYSGELLLFDLERRSSSVMKGPVPDLWSQQILATEDSRIGLTILSWLSINVWVIKDDSNGFPKWVLRKTVELEKLLFRTLGMSVGGRRPVIRGFAEDSSVLFVATTTGGLMIRLDTMQFIGEPFETSGMVDNPFYYPYASVYLQ